MEAYVHRGPVYTRTVQNNIVSSLILSYILVSKHNCKYAPEEEKVRKERARNYGGNTQRSRNRGRRRRRRQDGIYIYTQVYIYTHNNTDKHSHKEVTIEEEGKGGGLWCACTHRSRRQEEEHGAMKGSHGNCSHSYCSAARRARRTRRQETGIK